MSWAAREKSQAQRLNGALCEKERQARKSKGLTHENPDDADGDGGAGGDEVAGVGSVLMPKE